MKVSIQDIINLSILLNRSEEIGKIQDVIYNPKTNKVIGVIIEKSENLKDAQVILLSEIEEFTPNAIHIKSKDSVKKGEEVIKPYSPSGDDHFLRGTKAITEEGREAGKIQDIVFDTENGKVIEYVVDKDDKTETIKVEEVITASKSTTVVKKDNNTRTGDGVKSVISKAQETVEDIGKKIDKISL